MQLSERIRKFRKRYRVSQERFAELVGTTRGTVTSWEMGKHIPNQRAVLEKIEEVLRRGNPSLVKKVKVG